MQGRVGRAKMARLTGERHESLGLLLAVRIDAAEAQEPEVKVTATSEPLEQRTHAVRERPVAISDAIGPDPEEFLQGVVHDLLERVLWGSWLVAAQCGRGQVCQGECRSETGHRPSEVGVGRQET